MKKIFFASLLTFLFALCFINVSSASAATYEYTPEQQVIRDKIIGKTFSEVFPDPEFSRCIKNSLAYYVGDSTLPNTITEDYAHAIVNKDSVEVPAGSGYDVTSLKGLENFYNLFLFKINGTPNLRTVDLDFSQLPNFHCFEFYDCSRLTSVNITSPTMDTLTSYIGTPQLKSLVLNTPSLKRLQVYESSRLSSLDLSSCLNLENLVVHHSALSSIVFNPSSYTSLNGIDIRDNLFTNFDISKFTNLYFNGGTSFIDNLWATNGLKMTLKQNNLFYSSNLSDYNELFPYIYIVQ